MNIAHQQYIKQIIQEIDGDEFAKADIEEEIAIHLQLSSEQFVEAGYEKKEAEKLAMNEFGNTNKIGKQMQEAMFPYRKLMFISLVIASFLYAYFVYTAQLFSEGNAHFFWLLIAVTSSSLLLLFVLRVFPSLDRKLTLNSVLIIHAFTFGYGTLLASDLESNISILLTLFSWSILLITIILIYRTTVFDFAKDLGQLSRQTKVIHFINITIGIFIIAATLFFLWAFLAFGDGFNLRATFVIIPMIIWLITYYIQVRLTKNKKTTLAYIVAIIPAIMFVTITIWFFM